MLRMYQSQVLRRNILRLDVNGSRALSTTCCNLQAPTTFKETRIPTTTYHDELHPEPDYRNAIGDREIVGFGYSGKPNYFDSVHNPYPAIRWGRPTPEILALQEKERGDWKHLTIEEKKLLYRYSFRETWAEMWTTYGEWRHALGGTLILISIAWWWALILKKIHGHELPDSYSDENRLRMLKRMIDNKTGPNFGPASKWDYEKG